MVQITREIFYTFGSDTETIYALVYLPDGAIVTGKYVAQNPTEVDSGIGLLLAREDALTRATRLEEFTLRVTLRNEEKLHER